MSMSGLAIACGLLSVVQGARDRSRSLADPRSITCCPSMGTTVNEKTDILSRARQAHGAQDWATAAAIFDAVAAEPLTADDLAAYADAVWWVGRVEDSLRLEAAACES